MGSWNAVCTISNMHIRHNQEVMGLVLVKNGHPLDEYNTNYFWKPCILPFYGFYNEYGAMEACYGDVLFPLIEQTKKCLVEFEQGKDERHLPIKRDGFNINQMFEANTFDRFFVYDRVYPDTKLKAVISFIHKTTLDMVFSDFGMYDYRAGKHRSFEYYMSDLSDYLKHYHSLDHMSKLCFESTLKDFKCSFLLLWLYEHSRGDSIMTMYDILLYVKDVELQEKLLREALKVFWLCKYMESIHKYWSPTLIANQECDWNGLDLLCKIIAKQKETEKAEYADDFEEEDDELPVSPEKTV